jgi:ATP-binding cassette subfamily B protein/subfamily B ATP-binding cassette protein MsbA
MLIPKLVTFVLALQRLNIRLMRMANSLNLMAENSGRVEQLDQLLRAEGKAFRRQGGRPFTGLREGIRFEAVGLHYPARSEAALRGIDLAIPCGGTVALVGPSGAGKSSLADLLIGLLDPSEGRILVDGTDLRTLDLDSWQRRLGVVSQDVLLVNDTIGANIAFGLAEQPPEPALRAAAAAAGAEDFIKRLPKGYATVIGERGYRLSGGQRQRLSLARAILRDPEVLILDEATSALDSHAEAQIHRALEAFRSGRTVLSIAHRLSSIVHADLIAVVEHGTIVEQGRHPELLARQGVYASLWRRQQKGGTQATEARP